jgi:8-oxo-dGTP pyrophosphatase MutT (NUDIX family)
VNWDDEIAGLRSALARHVPQPLPRPPELAAHRPAAVLVPVVRRGDTASLLFMQRVEDQSAHSGQISFPGGKVDAADADAIAAALREAEEEVGLERTRVEVIGRLGELPTPSGYIITPVVGLVTEPPPAYRLSAGEAAEAFEVPLAKLRDPATFEDRGEITRWGWTWRTCAYRPDGRFIWGATARMVNELLAVWK